MLSDYGVENAGTRIVDKENDLFNIECPFIAYQGGNFVVVYKIGNPSPALPQGEGVHIHYLWNGKKTTVTVEQFIKSWSGIILLAETTPDSGEQDYKEHRRQEFFNIAQKTILVIAVVLLFIIAYFQLFSSSVYQGIAGLRYTTPAMTENYQLLSYSIILLLNLAGVYIGYLLVLKQMHIHSQYADKICSLFHQSDCNNVLESDAAKLWGVFGWSEIGLGYFAANVILLLFLPQTISLLAIINIFTLPYSFWSVWYQKVKARQWCPLCLIVQVLLWGIFIANILFGTIKIPDLGSAATLLSLLSTGSIYAIFIFSLNLIIPNLSRGREIEQIKQEINSIKSDEEVFKTLLTGQPHYEVSKVDSQILFGNPAAQLQITILTNPFCNPCARMHKRVENLLKETNENVCIQYIFSSFTPELDFANKYLIAAGLGKDKATFREIIADWFEKGKPLKEEFFKDLQLDINNPEVEAEFKRHQVWKEKTQLRATPTILVEGYKLPDNYKIEDLRYFTEFNVNIK